MSGYVLTWRDPQASAPSDGAVLLPELAQLDKQSLLAMPLTVGRDVVPLGERFDVEGEPGDTLTLRRLPPLDRLGEAMTWGILIIDGPAGDDLGASMRGGLIRVRGNAGARVGGPSAGRHHGMTDGEIVIEGDAGEQCGLNMRRGMIVVTGNTGAYPGHRMAAGTIVVVGAEAPSCQYGAGLEMRRGTIVFLGATPMVAHPSLAVQGEYAAAAVPILSLLLRRVAALEVNVTHPPRWRLSSGDMMELGKGEIWQAI